MLPELARVARTIPHAAPKVPWFSTCTGRLLTGDDLADGRYWPKQVRSTVRFADALEAVLSDGHRLLLEVGPGGALGQFARQHPATSGDLNVLGTLDPATGAGGELSSMLRALGSLWTGGVEPDWNAFYAHEKRRRVPLPTYPFERKRYWVEPAGATTGMAQPSAVPVRAATVSDRQPTAEAAASSSEHANNHRTKLITLLQELSGADQSQFAPAASFLDLGFDSLFLTQASQAIQHQLGVKVTLRQLMEDLSTLDDLVAYLETHAPLEAPAAPATAPAASPATAGPVITAVKHETEDTSRFGPFASVDRGPSRGLSTRQQSALDSLVRRYNHRTAKSKDHAQRHRAHFCDPRTAGNFRQLWKEMVYPIVCARSHGARIWNVDDNEYLDVTMGFGANYLGHSPDFVVNAVEEQMRRGIEIGPQSPLAGEVAEMICELTGMERATFCNTGSEATMAAFRAARTVTGRDKIVYFRGDYHGIFDEVLGRPALVNGQAGAVPIAPGIPHLANVMVLQYGSQAALETIRQHAHEIAAVMVEPVQSRRPHLQPREFLYELRRLTEQRDIALIFDEIITGFRVAPGGAQQHFAVKADLATYGKVVGGGMPIGVLAGRARYMDALDGGFWRYGDKSSPPADVTFFAGTFVRHPLTMAAAHAVMSFVRDAGPGLQEATNIRTASFVATMNEHFEAVRVPMHLQGFSAIFYNEFHPGLKYSNLLFCYLRDRGIHIWEGRLGCLSTAHSDQDMEVLIDAYKESVAEMQDGGFLPGLHEAILHDAKPAVVLCTTDLLSALPMTPARIVCLDTDENALGTAVTPDCRSHSLPDDLAYVIYTSGSTGKPKGVEIHHRSVVNFLASMEREPGLTCYDVMLAVTTFSFDIAVLELVLPLTVGARVVIASRQTAMDPHRLMGTIGDAGVTVMQATPSTWRMLFSGSWTGKPELKVICGGEAMPPDLADSLLDTCREVWNVYGPTETTVWSTVKRLERGKPITIGRPIANTQVYIVDDSLTPMPIGVPGELVIGGAGVGRGYHDLPELTREKFISDPFAKGAAARAYRTGDQARLRADGEIEFLGRNDSQVKIRGHRIELGEVESVLLSHPDVREGVVVARDDDNGGKQLVAYVSSGRSKTRDTGHWAEVWESLFERALAERGTSSHALETLDSTIFGWTDGQQDSANAERQVEEWIKSTVRSLEALSPDRVLEIGCGTGQLLLRLAPKCSVFWGTDIAANAISALGKATTAPGSELSHVTLMQRSAVQFDGIPAGHFDTVVLNSVSQYFPDVEYLVRVMEGAVRSLRAGGRVFVGDIQSYALMECYQTAAQVNRLPGDTSVDALKQIVQRRMAAEDELMVDPAFFHALKHHLAQISHVEIQLRRGRSLNEATQFHYDAILHVGGDTKPVQVETWLDWQADVLNLESLKRLLTELDEDVVGIRRVPNARLNREAALLDMVGTVEPTWHIHRLVESLHVDPQAVDPEDLWGLAEELGLRADVKWHGGRASGPIDVVFRKPGAAARSGITDPNDVRDAGPWSDYANSPARRESESNLVAGLRQLVKSRLPDYMAPASYVVLDSLPRTPNNKIARQALPAPGRPTEAVDSYVAPRNAREKKLAAIWADVLSLRQVGVTDGFFDLGGHSLLAVTAFGRIEKEFGVRLPLSTLFEKQTIEQLVTALPEHVTKANFWPCLVPIRESGSKAPFFCVHGAGGNVLLYRELARHLGDDVPFYGLQSRGMDGSGSFATDLEKMASNYLEEIRAVQPTGAFNLGGYCMGGLVAYEMAQ